MTSDGPRPVVLMLPGQGSQHPRMAHELYDHEPIFAGVFDGMLGRCGAEGHLIRKDWLEDNPEIAVDDATRAQPLLFAIEYAIARTLQHLGIKVAAAVGHSVGELTAAGLAGVFDHDAAARVVLARSHAMAAAPPGGMVAIGASPTAIASLLPQLDPSGTVGVGAYNSPLQTLICGPDPALRRTCAALREMGLPGVRMAACQPFHSPAVGPAAVEFTRGVAAERLYHPMWPVYSTRTGAPVTPAEAVNPGFWGDQLRRPVLFWPALDRLLSDYPDAVLVETGPGQVLATIARRHPAVRSGRATVHTMQAGPKAAPGEGWAAWREALAELRGETGTALAA